MGDSAGSLRGDLWKKDLRSRLTQARRDVSLEDRGAAGAAIAERVLALPEVVTAGVVAAYQPLRDEPGTEGLLDELRSRGRTVLLPTLLPDRDLAWTPYGIDRADVVLVPGVAFDPAGHRLGRGGGSYDRALTRIREGTIVVGLNYDECVVEEVPTEPHDRTVDVVVTPTRVMRTRTP